MEYNIGAVLLVLELTVFSVAQYSDGQCHDANNQIGECVNVKQCLSLITLLNAKDHRFSGIHLLQKNQCGFEGIEPLVCCIKNQENDTPGEPSSNDIPDEFSSNGTPAKPSDNVISFQIPMINQENVTPTTSSSKYTIIESSSNDTPGKPSENTFKISINYHTESNSNDSFPNNSGKNNYHTESSSNGSVNDNSGKNNYHTESSSKGSVNDNSGKNNVTMKHRSTHLAETNDDNNKDTSINNSDDTNTGGGDINKDSNKQTGENTNIDTSKNTNTDISGDKKLNRDLLPDAECGRDLSNRIFGGNTTEIDEFTWMALLVYKKPEGNTTACGGAAITKRYVATAGHCLKGKALPKSWVLIAVRLGEYNTATNVDCIPDGSDGSLCADKPQTITIEEQIIHEDYDPDSKDQLNDLALLRLAQDIIFSRWVSPICLPRGPELGKKFVVSGWGKTENNQGSDVKLKVTVPIADKQMCVEKYKNQSINLGPHQICAGGIEGRDSCRGDSGGPLMQLVRLSAGTTKWTQVGVVSFGPTPCGMKGWPGVYTKLFDYLPWILSKIRI